MLQKLIKNDLRLLLTWVTPPGWGLAGVWGFEETGGVMGPCRAGELAFGVGHGLSSWGIGVGGLSSSDWDLLRLMAFSSTYLLKNDWNPKIFDYIKVDIKIH